MAIPVIIVTGFLGCGKTSFLRHLLPRCGDAGVRPALIINEIGDVDVDGELLADLHAEQARLVGGCVCCTLQSQLSQTVFDILERKACDVIIIECSGMSNPVDVLSVMSMPALLREVAVSHVVCLVNTKKARQVLATVELVKHQIATADILIFNKTDILADEERPAVEALANDLNTHAARHWASYGDIGHETLLDILNDPAPMRPTCTCGHNHDHDHDHGHDHHTHRSLPASFFTVAIPLPRHLERPAVEELLASLPENVIRVKGFANIIGEGWHVLHRVYDSVDLIPFTDSVPTIGAVLVCIGQNLDSQELARMVDEQLRAIVAAM